jgi:hypothetical protein
MNLRTGLDHLEREVERLLSERNELLAVAYEALEFVEDQVDVIDGAYGQPEANRAMVLAHALGAAIRLAGGKV